MFTANLRVTGTVAGVAFDGTQSGSGDGGKAHVIPLPAGTAGTLTSRGDDDTGDFTLESGHGLATNDVVDVYWDGGVRYNCTLNDVTGDVAQIYMDGSGDVFPAQDTAVVVTEQVRITSDFDGDDVQLITVGCDQRCHLDFQDSGTATLLAVDLSADELWQWAAERGIANPLTGNPVADIYASNGSSTTAATLGIGIVYDSTPG